MSACSAERFEQIIQEAIEKADEVSCSIDSCLEGYRSMRESLDERIQCLESETG